MFAHSASTPALARTRTGGASTTTSTSPVSLPPAAGSISQSSSTSQLLLPTATAPPSSITSSLINAYRKPAMPRQLPALKEKPRQATYSHVPLKLKAEIPYNLPPPGLGGPPIGISNPYPVHAALRTVWGDAGPSPQEREILGREIDKQSGVSSLTSTTSWTRDTERRVYMKHKHKLGEREAPTVVIQNLRTGQEFSRSHADNPDQWHGKKHVPITAYKEEMRRQPAFQAYRFSFSPPGMGTS